jgi:hypothetical protein
MLSINRSALAATASASSPPPKKRIASMRLRRAEVIERATMSLYGTATTPLMKAYSVQSVKNPATCRTAFRMRAQDSVRMAHPIDASALGRASRGREHQRRTGAAN